MGRMNNFENLLKYRPQLFVVWQVFMRRQPGEWRRGNAPLGNKLLNERLEETTNHCRSPGWRL